MADGPDDRSWPGRRREANLTTVATEEFPELLVSAPPIRLPLWEFVRASGLDSLILGTSKDPNAKITVLLISPQSGRPVLAVKAPTTDEAARAVDAEARVLADLWRLQPRDVAETIPRVVDLLEVEGRPAIVTTAVPGVPMTTTYLGRRHTASSLQVAADFNAAGRWLADFQAGTARQSAPIEMDGGVALRLRKRFLDDERLSGDLARLAEICSRLQRNKVARTAVHGDFWFGNVLLVDGEVAGVVDWEAGTISGEPVRDLVRFALIYALYLDCRTRAGRRVAGHAGLRADAWGAGIEYALNGTGWFPDLFRRFIGEGLGRLGASPASWRDAALAGLAEVAALTDDDGFARLHLELFRRVSDPEAELMGAR
jgi:aminoglycoside phosphotransferase (APT) family kinase protein